MRMRKKCIHTSTTHETCIKCSVHRFAWIYRHFYCHISICMLLGNRATTSTKIPHRSPTHKWCLEQKYCCVFFFRSFSFHSLWNHWTWMQTQRWWVRRISTFTTYFFFCSVSCAAIWTNIFSKKKTDFKMKLNYKLWMESNCKIMFSFDVKSKIDIES